jgi:hypothetical protein
MIRFERYQDHVKQIVAKKGDAIIFTECLQVRNDESCCRSFDLTDSLVAAARDATVGGGA